MPLPTSVYLVTLQTVEKEPKQDIPEIPGKSHFRERREKLDSHDFFEEYGTFWKDATFCEDRTIQNSGKQHIHEIQAKIQVTIWSS